MVVVDTSAWIEYFKGSQAPEVALLDNCLDHDFVVLGDLIYCEVMQGIGNRNERERITRLFLSLPRYPLVGFEIAGKAAANYRHLRTQGVTVGKTIDVIIATFCMEKSFYLIHCDRDFDFIAEYLPLKVIK